MEPQRQLWGFFMPKTLCQSGFHGNACFLVLKKKYALEKEKAHCNEWAFLFLNSVCFRSEF
jgi:hypothetical protein